MLNEVHLEELGFLGLVFFLFWGTPCRSIPVLPNPWGPGTALLLPGGWWVQQSLTLSWLRLWWAGDSSEDLGLVLGPS